MCDFFSCIIVDKNKKALWHPDIDSHTELLEHFGLKDESPNPNFVRVEFTPPNGDVFDHDFSKWNFQVDQDFKPGWFDVDEAKKLCLSGVKKLIDERFIIDRDLKEIKEGRWWVGGKSKVERVHGSAQIKSVYGSAQIEYVHGSAQIKSVSGSAQIKSVSGSAQIESVYGSAQIKSVYDSAQIKSVYGSAQIESVYGSAQIESVYGSAQIKSVSGSAQIESVYGSAQIESVYGGIVQLYSNKAKVLALQDNGLVIVCYTDNPKILTANPKITLEQFKEIK